MLLTRLSVHRPIATAMAVLAVVIGGVIALFNLPVDLMPNTESKTVTIFVGVRGGMPPEDIENLVTVPIEESMATLNGLASTLSVSRKDRATITLDFNDDVDIKRASLDVSERVSRVRGKLPKEIEKPIVARYNENDSPIVILSATSSVKTPEVLRTMIERDLKPLLSRVPGVANVEIGGGRQRKILVEFEKSKLEAHGLPILEVINQLGSNNLNLTSGRFDSGRDTMGVQFLGDFQSLDEMKELGIAVTKEGSRIRLKDVAVVRDYYLEPESYARVNNQPAVSIYVQKESGANTIRAASEVMRVVRTYQKSIPADVGLGVSVDQSVAIRQSIADVRGALTVGAILTALILWLFLRTGRQVLVIVCSIPVAVLGTFLAMMFHSEVIGKLIGVPPITINVMSLLGVALGIGRMVDDSIVVFENILHKNEIARSQGKFFSKDMAIEATSEMALAVASSTLVMVVIFLPIVLVSADIRRLYADVAFTVVMSLFASLFMAFTVIPLLASRTMPGPGQTLADLEFDWEKKFKRWWSVHGVKYEMWIRSRFIRFPKKPFSLAQGEGGRKPDEGGTPSPCPLPVEGRGGESGGFHAFLRHWTSRAVRHRRLVLILVVLSMVASAVIYVLALPKEYMGGGQKDEFVIFVELPAGTKLDVSDRVVAAVEAEINAMPEVKEIVKTVSARVEGWSSKIYVTLAPGGQRTRGAQDVIDYLRPKLKSIGGEYEAFVYFSEPTSGSEMVIDVFGPDYLTLRDLAVEIAKRLQPVKGLRDVKLRYKPGQPEVRLDVDHARASMFGLSSKEIADTLHAEIRGLRATYFNSGSDQVETVARLSEEDRRTLDQVSNLTIMSNGRKRTLVPIEQVISLEHDFTPSEVWRKDKERVIQVSGSREKMALSTAVKKIQAALKGLKVPTGYHYEVGGDYKKLVKSEREFIGAFLAMIILVYIVLACFFESYTQPALMLLTLPLATAGSIPMLWITRTPVNMGVYIGLLMLGGTVVSNAIILIDRLNDVKEKRGLLRSVLKVGQERARPIFMTSLTTIIAMVPLLFEAGESSDLWRPLALTVVSGLALSSVLTLFVIPAAYVVLEDLKKLIKTRVQSSELRDL